MIRFTKTLLSLSIIYYLLSIISAAHAAPASSSASLSVSATVPEHITLTINGVADSTLVNNGNDKCASETITNTGISSTTDTVSLGTLVKHLTRVSAQLLTITTNSAKGYALTAVAESPLKDALSGFSFPVLSTPTSIRPGISAFGIHPCGKDVDIKTWGKEPNDFYALPVTDPLILAQNTSGPIGERVTPGSGRVTIKYAATIDNKVPGGDYKTRITYTVTPSF